MPLKPFAAFIWSAAILCAQPKIPPTRPEVLGVFPHGGQRGTDVDVAIRGRNLQDASALLFATSKLSGKITGGDHNTLRVRIHLDRGAEPGRHDFRLIAPHGSTIGWFDVSDRAESVEKEPNNDREHAQRIALPVLMNGMILAGDYDYFRFEAIAGQTLTFDVNATRNGSPLDSVISLLDENGVELAYSDDYYMFKDPHVVYRFEKAGTYYVRIYGSGESGSEASDYRLMAGAMPQVDYAMPAGARRGSTVEVKLAGVNLQGVEKVTLGDGLALGEVVRKAAGSATIRLRVPKDAPLGPMRLHIDGATLPLPFVISDLPEITVTGDAARSLKDPVPVELPVIANGVLDKPRAGNYFAFRVEKPETVLLNVDSMQLGFLLDPMVAIYDESGRRIAWQDDITTNTGKEPSNLDPHLVFKLPQAGRYVAMVRDSQFRGDPTFAYRFTLKKAEPDFTVKVIGTDETLFRGRDNVVVLRVRRAEGWDAPVEIWADDLPPGVTAAKAIAKPENTPYKGTCGEDHLLDGTNVEIAFKVAADAPGGIHQIRFRARGVMNGRAVEHEARARYWWRTLQKVRGDSETTSLFATIADPPQLVLTTPERINVSSGRPQKVKVVIARLDGGKAPLRIEPSEQAAGLKIEPVTVPAGATLAEVSVLVEGDSLKSFALAGKAAGKTLGVSHPIVIDRKKGNAEVAADEN